MRYGSVCSGIEAATQAWHPLGWRASFVSEIEAFPRAVLQHRHPGIPLHGDFTTIGAGEYEPIDLLVGGTPCQSFSIAGLRGGLGDDRGNLALEYLRLADRLRPRWLVWENVPGVLSSAGGRDFGAILGGMVELGYGVAYRVLDAQYVRTCLFPWAVPQRRRRVFVVGYLGDWRPPAAVLFDGESLSGNPPPRREAGKGVAPTISARTKGGGGLGTDFDLDGGLDQATVTHALRGEGFDACEDGTGRGTPLGPVAFGGNNTAGPISVATAVNAHAVPHGRCDFESETFVVAEGFANAGHFGSMKGVADSDPLRARGGDAGSGAETLIAHAFDARQSDVVQYGPATGPLDTDGYSDAVAYSIMPMNSGKDYKAREVAVAQPVMAAGPAGPAGGNQGGDYIVQPMAFALRGREEGAVPEVEGDGDATSALRAASGGSSRDYVAFTAKDYGADAGEVSPTVRGGNHDKSWANGGVMPAVAGAFGVRRLTPRECERLMGFPDDHTLIPWRKGLAPDGPRYKAIGNSMAVPVMSWLGHRIQMVEDLMERS